MVLEKRLLWSNEGNSFFSEYAENSKLYNKANIEVISIIKDETKDVPIAEFVWLKSKIYWFIKEDEKGDKNTKRITKNNVENMTHEEYKNRSFEWKNMLHEMKRIEIK